MVMQFDPSLTPVRDLRDASREMPDRPFLTVGSRTYTYAEVYERVETTARGLRSHGVVAGDRVVIIAPNRIESVVMWFAVHALGAVDAPVSVEAAGAFLRYLVEDLEPTVVVGTAETLAVVGAAVAAPVPLAVIIGEGDDAGVGKSSLRFDELAGRAAHDAEDIVLPDAGVLGTIMYSSGTTGPSKGVMLAQGYCSSLAEAHIEGFGLSTGQRFYCAQPLCHIDARSSLVDALRLRGESVMGERFSASRFWDEVLRHDADVFFYVGTMVHLLMKQPERADRSPKRRIGVGSATPPTLHREFEDRYNVVALEGYGLTEFALIAAQSPASREPGTVGRPLPWVDVRIVDDQDVPVERGAVGELIVRPDGPSLHMLGYWRKDPETVRAWRGLWFHTGDLIRELPTGALEYVGRNKDSIRRRGENVSAWEVEETAARHAAVLEAAAIGVPSDLGEEDVALLVVPSGAEPLDPALLREYMAADLPRFALPRYVEIVDELPKTPSERIAKGAVRERGLTSAAIDLEATSRSA